MAPTWLAGPLSDEALDLTPDLVLHSLAPERQSHDADDDQ
jgi:hypothetical protein